MGNKTKTIFCISILMSIFTNFGLSAQIPLLPSNDELNRPFGIDDSEKFSKPPNIYKPETWFHFIGGNISKDGITADLEAIDKAGFSGIQLFHGQFGGAWPGVEPQIICLSPLWEDAVAHTARECERLGLSFTMVNCPGWATAGGPWIEPSNAMRYLVWSRTDISDGGNLNKLLPRPQPSSESWRDYRDIAVLAFPTPEGDNNKFLTPDIVESNIKDSSVNKLLVENLEKPIVLSPTSKDNPYWIEVTFSDVSTVRTIQFPSINSFNHAFCYEPGVTVKVEAVLNNGTTREVLQTDMPQSNWQDDMPISLACDEIKGVRTYRISIVNEHEMKINSLRLFSAARKNNWESGAGWTLRGIMRNNEHPEQSSAAFIDPSEIKDITTKMDENGKLEWNAPPGQWTILRIGHVNTGAKNGPAPPEGTGWESNKLSKSGANAQFDGYIGELTSKNGPVNGLLDGVLIDSWECETQTWTKDMEAEFNRINDYALRKWLPALFGYVINDHETSTRFLRDWRSTISALVTNKFYGQMAKLTHENGQFITFETAVGDVFPGDIMEYFKYADVPMCEFWQHPSENFVGSKNFKPIKPTVSAARLYGKPRVAAEAFTSFTVTWDEHLSLLKEAANLNMVEGVTHLVFHTYTHNPRTDFFPPGSSFGSAEIGTPFLRGQTWWKYMPNFTTYLARSSYLLERGKPVSDVLWYLGDEINHKPDQKTNFPDGFKFDYCNPDILLNRLSVKDGFLVTPEGLRYRVLWLPDTHRMLPETLEKLLSLVEKGATIIGDPPAYLATLSNSDHAQVLFDQYVSKIWGETSKTGIRKVGSGKVVSGMELSRALDELKVGPDVLGGYPLWLHRQTDNVDWYYISAPKGSGFKGDIDFRSSGNVEIWDPLTGSISAAAATPLDNNYTRVSLDIPRAGACFVVFKNAEKIKRNIKQKRVKRIQEKFSFNESWNLSFPSGWGAPSSIQIDDLKAWKDLNLSGEGKAFSGTAVYSNTFTIDGVDKELKYVLDLGKVEMIADIFINGEQIRTLWSPPYKIDITNAVKTGKNYLTIDVTSSWFNRLVYDAGLPKEKRKTWTIKGPSENSVLKESGIMGPVVLYSTTAD